MLIILILKCIFFLVNLVVNYKQKWHLDQNIYLPYIDSMEYHRELICGTLQAEARSSRIFPYKEWACMAYVII